MKSASEMRETPGDAYIGLTNAAVVEPLVSVSCRGRIPLAPPALDFRFLVAT